MGGNCGESKTWATSYDSSVAEAMSTTDTLIAAMGNYATILQRLGYTWAYADYEETGGRPEPVEPTPFEPLWLGCQAPPPAADGPGSGLFDDVGFAVDALAQFGLEMPDGDPHKLLAAADVWSKFASQSGAGNLPTLLDGLAESFESETAPELADVDDHLRELKVSASAVLDLYSNLAQGCRDHRNAILTFRTKMGQLLVDLAGDLAEEIAETVVLSIVAGALTAGMGAAAVTAAKAGKLAVKLKKYVDRTIDIKIASKFVGKIGGNPEALAARKAKLQEIASLTTKLMAKRPNPKQLGDLFAGRTPKASELEDFAKSQGWTRSQTEGGPIKYTDENGVIRVTIKSGSSRAPGSGNPHVELRDGSGQRTDPEGNPVTRKSPGNHTPIDWDL